MPKFQNMPNPITERLEYALKSWTFEGEEKQLLEDALWKIKDLTVRLDYTLERIEQLSTTRKLYDAALDRASDLEMICENFAEAFKWGGAVNRPYEGTWNRSQLDRALRNWRDTP